ncbi:MAG: cyclodeaminase/cyclohydrolase family protein [Thermaerobacter sp.]|nr:cyclodeaminase/cyclohydrolase family protein [Thermaerobacter sp.]
MSLWELRVTEFLEQLGAGSANPAAGTAAALTGACGAALAVMTANLTVGRMRFQAVAAEAEQLRDQARSELLRLSQLGEEDAALFSDPDRVSMSAATRVPLDIAAAAVRVAEAAHRLGEIGNPVAKGDARVGMLLSLAAAEGALAVVEVNLAFVPEGDFRLEALARHGKLREEVVRLRDATQGSSATHG